MKKNSRREYRDYLHDISMSAENAIEFLGVLNVDEFIRDRKTNFAVVRALEIIGEAAKKIPRSMRDKYPKIPWKEMAGMRDKISHEYFGVNLVRVWETVKRDLPPLRVELKRLMTELK